jgi:alpha-1,3-mannosyltransferase
MNVLLFSPGLLILFIQFLGWQGTAVQLILCALIQLALGAPFLLSHPISYLNGAFNFSRVFFYQWTVNWRMLPEWIFLHKAFHVFLLMMHVLVLIAFAVKYWTRYVTVPMRPHYVAMRPHCPHTMLLYQ